MKKQKTIWRSIGIPLILFKRVRKLIVDTGHPSVAEYVREAVAFKMKDDLERIEAAFHEV